MRRPFDVAEVVLPRRACAIIDLGACTMPRGPRVGQGRGGNLDRLHRQLVVYPEHAAKRQGTGAAASRNRHIWGSGSLAPFALHELKESAYLDVRAEIRRPVRKSGGYGDQDQARIAQVLGLEARQRWRPQRVRAPLIAPKGAALIKLSASRHTGLSQRPGLGAPDGG